MEQTKAGGLDIGDQRNRKEALRYDKIRVSEVGFG